MRGLIERISKYSLEMGLGVGAYDRFDDRRRGGFLTRDWTMLYGRVRELAGMSCR